MQNVASNPHNPTKALSSHLGQASARKYFGSCGASRVLGSWQSASWLDIVWLTVRVPRANTNPHLNALFCNDKYDLHSVRSVKPL